MTGMFLGILTSLSLLWCNPLSSVTKVIPMEDEIKIVICPEMTQEDIEEEMRLGELETLAQLVEAEAGNQGFHGKSLVADVVLNRVGSELFPDTIEEVIFQNNQFSVIKDGGFDAAGWNMSDKSFEAVWSEYLKLSNEHVLYFSKEKSKYATYQFKYKDHWFGY